MVHPIMGKNAPGYLDIRDVVKLKIWVSRKPLLCDWFRNGSNIKCNSHLLGRPSLGISNFISY
ncbi:MAG: hypothetical protein GF317_09515 [Candidatus Lokiarchaeota archaeon]|nr:hypothetical protein [Candidatus Lokiarchaeota archaeon]MBD3199949.1 hypothetical protein [Candidatus Lokiarchaeota archaeon]